MTPTNNLDGDLKSNGLLKDKKKLYVVMPIIIVFLCAVVLGFLNYRLNLAVKNQKANFEKINKEGLDLKVKLDKIIADYAKAQKDLEFSAAERDKLNVQIKGLLVDRDRARELETILESAKKQNESLLKDKDNLGKTKQETIEESLVLREKIKELETIKKQLLTEKEQLGQSLEEARKKIGYSKLEQDNLFLKKENSQLVSSLNQRVSEIAKLQESQTKIQDESGQMGKKVEDLSRNLAEAIKKNDAFENRLVDAPSKFVEIARQNKVLVRRTANMHYNMGVFYTKQKEYSRAIAELEKSVELVPDDAAAHFNLGYIYAEYLVNRPKAIDHFRKYLRYCKKDDKDVDWVRKYIVTWQTWEGKQSIE